MASRLRAEADELSRAYVRVPRRKAIVPRPATAVRRVQPAASRGTLGHTARPDARARDVAGRRAHLLPRRSDRGRDRAKSPDGARGVRGAGLRSRRVQARDDAGAASRHARAVADVRGKLANALK